MADLREARTHSPRVRRAEEELKQALSEENRDQEAGAWSPALETAGDLGKPIAASESPRFDLENLFTYHPPSFRDMRQYEAIRTAAKYFATVILQNTPVGADQTATIRKLRECVMTANASIALEGR